MEISLKQLKLLLQTLADGGASEFDYRDEKYRVHVTLGRSNALPAVGHVLQQPSVVVSSAPAEATKAALLAAEAADTEFMFVTSPFVGTFYRAASPDAPPFVSPGSAIKPGLALCIIEAMKLMNEIEAEFPGVIEEVLVENGKSVEYGQKLFKVRKS